MLKVNRNSFLKSIATISTGLIGFTSKSNSSPKNILSDDRFGVLVDTTICIGCRNCEWACKKSHNLTNESFDEFIGKEIVKKQRRPDDKFLTVVNSYANESLSINVKFQCMHCDKPACVSACIVGAFSKNENGAVTWDTDKCIGCRYCMIACPFQIPSFEYEEAFYPSIMKCDFCNSRLNKNEIPACVEICPVEALLFGPKTELLKIAKDRIKKNPKKYINKIFGEKEVGGTSWMYLSSRDFNKLGFPKVGEKTAPGTSESIQHGIFAYFVPPFLLYALLGIMMWITKNKKEIITEKINE